MHLEVRLNKKASAKIYTRDIIDSSKMPWIKQHINSNIDKKTLDLASKFSRPIYLSSMTSKELGRLVAQFNLISNRIKKIHDKEWKIQNKDIKSGFRLIKKFIGSKNNIVAEEIQNNTGIAWGNSEIVIYPAIYNGGTIMDNEVYIGINKNLETNYLDVLIHELVHINTNKEYELIRKGLRFPEDSKEICCVE